MAQAATRHKTQAWVAWSVTVTLIAISRIYVAAHLPMQTVWGLVAGIITLAIVQHALPNVQSWWCHRSVTEQLRLVVIFSVVTIFVIMGELYTLTMLGDNPNASVGSCHLQ